jgi:4-alpha-glucanotransferase
LLHPTSLPGGYGIGELGDHAYAFVDFLVESGQSLWQILPLGPTGYGDSPYACFSAFAGNPLLIALDPLAEEGDVDPQDLAQAPAFPEDHVDYGPVIDFKMAILHRAARHFRAHAGQARMDAFEQFCEENAAWLEDYVLFMALKEAHGGAVWNTWEWDLVSRDPGALAEWRERLDENIFAHCYFQYQFFRQWEKLKAYANDKDILIVGDIPIFVAYDSAEVWARPELFALDDDYLPTVVAGVPPDYFSETGQLWGNPLYRWDVDRALRADAAHGGHDPLGSLPGLRRLLGDPGGRAHRREGPMARRPRRAILRSGQRGSGGIAHYRRGSGPYHARRGGTA